jgi:ELWxxDGT repeat protein
VSLGLRYAAALLSSGLACTYPATEVVVELDTDVPAGRALMVSVFARTGPSAMSYGPELRRWERGTGPSKIGLPASFAMVPAPKGARDGAVSMVVQAVLGGSDGTPPVAIRRIARFVFIPRLRARVRLFLAARCANRVGGCLHQSADACTLSAFCEERGQTCGDDAGCVSQDVVPEPYVSGPSSVGPSPDTGVDSARAGPDAAESPQDVAITGVSTCQAGYTLCGATCVDLQRDPANCGRCGFSCVAAPDAGVACNSGACMGVCRSAPLAQGLDAVNVGFAPSVVDGTGPGMVAAGGRLFLSATDSTHGSQLWVTDGTACGTAMLTNANVPSGGLRPEGLGAVGARVFFEGGESTNGVQLWTSDGTSAGTRMLSNFSWGTAAIPMYLTPVGTTLYFADPSMGAEARLWAFVP